jgi:hypothetical protein
VGVEENANDHVLITYQQRIFFCSFPLGFVHSTYLFGLESHIAHTSINGNIVPPGALLSLIQKGLYYTEAELTIGDVSKIDVVTFYFIVRILNHRFYFA